MAPPLFKLQLVYPDGSKISFNGAGTFERNLVSTITTEAVRRILASLPSAVRSRGVGFGRTEAHVVRDVTDAVYQTLPTVIEESVMSVLLTLKEETIRLL